MNDFLSLPITKQMASGQWFEAADVGLAADRSHAQKVMRRFSADLSLDDEGRMQLLRNLFGSLGEGSAVSEGARVDYGYNVFIGKNCFFNFNCVFLDGAPITFGDDVWVGPGVTFATPIHPLLPKERRMRFDEDGTAHLFERNEAITVGNDVWIASDVTVNAGVTIGEGAVIASGSVVTKDIPAYTLAAGVPCKPIRKITAEDSILAELDKR